MFPPFQIKPARNTMKVTLVNLNLITIPSIAPYALDVLGSSIEASGHEVDILDLCRESEPSTAIRVYFASHQPDLVALSMRNAVDLYFPSFVDLDNKGSFLFSHRELIDTVKQCVDPSRIIIGGVGFSTNPASFLKRFGLRYGVAGPGEGALCQVLNQLPQSSLMKQADNADTFVFDGRGNDIWSPVSRKYVDNKWYYDNGGQAAFRTSVGCAMRCAYCAEPAAMGGRYSKGTIDNTLSEIDQLVAIGIRDLQTADSEFNMPIARSKELLRRIIERGYSKDVRFWAYCQPRPFDEEYANLLARAGVAGINFGTDHTDPEVLSGLGKWYSREHIAQATRLCQDNGIAVMHELLFGSPGDTPDKMYRAIEDVRKLAPWVIGVSIGLGVFPNTPLGVLFENAKTSATPVRGFYVAGEPMVDPTFYVDSSFKVPEVFEALNRRVGTNCANIMMPVAHSTSSKHNQLVNSERVRHQLLTEKGKGPSWYHFPVQPN